MLSWGGRHDVDEGNRSVCDSNGNADFLLDVSRGIWVDTFDPALEYQVPQEVVDATGGSFVPPLSPPFPGHLRFSFADELDSPSGGATKLRPEGGWGGNDELASIMRRKSPKDSSTPSEDGESDIGTPPPESSNHTGAIVGSVVGGPAALAGLFFFLLRRRSRVNGGSPEALRRRWMRARLAHRWTRCTKRLRR